MKKNSPRSIFLLLLTALVWGFGFVAQDMATGSVRAFTFNGTRMALAALVVFLFCLYRDSRGKGDPETGDGVPFRQMTASQKKTLLLGGASAVWRWPSPAHCSRSASSRARPPEKPGLSRPCTFYSYRWENC